MTSSTSWTLTSMAMHYPEDTPALFSYWESVFHVDDDLNFP